MLQPASTLKMYTSAVALDRFGPDFRVQDAVLRDAPVESDGSVGGNLYLRGMGDPSLARASGTTRIRWTRSPPRSRPRASRTFTAISSATRAAFDDSWFPKVGSTSYLGASYAARVSALSLNENLVWVAVEPSDTKAVVTLEPATTTIPVENTFA